jgi:hypothetical protein
MTPPGTTIRPMRSALSIPFWTGRITVSGPTAGLRRSAALSVS